MEKAKLAKNVIKFPLGKMTSLHQAIQKNCFVMEGNTVVNDKRSVIAKVIETLVMMEEMEQYYYGSKGDPLGMIADVLREMREDMTIVDIQIPPKKWEQLKKCR